MVLAERMPFPGRGHEDSAQIAMSLEPHAEHVPRLAFVPVGGVKDVGHAPDRGRFASQRDLDPEVLIALEGKELIDDGEIARRLIVPVRPLPLIDHSQIEKRWKRSRRVVLQITQTFARLIGLNPCRRHAVARLLSLERSSAESGFQQVQNRRIDRRRRAHLRITPLLPRYCRVAALRIKTRSATGSRSAFSSRPASDPACSA